MKKILATAFVAGLAAAGLTTAQAYAAPGDVTVEYGCNSATFTNNLAQEINVNYGTASSGDAVALQIPAGKSVKVMSKAKNFGYTATTADGTEAATLAWPGVDLTGTCSRDELDEQASLLTAEYGCNSATFTNRTGGQVVLQYGQQNSGDTNQVTLSNEESQTIHSTADNFGWLAKDKQDGYTINVREGGIDLTATCTSTQPTKAPATAQQPGKAPATAKQPVKESRGGLARTGV